MNRVSGWGRAAGRSGGSSTCDPHVGTRRCSARCAVDALQHQGCRRARATRRSTRAPYSHAWLVGGVPLATSYLPQSMTRGPTPCACQGSNLRTHPLQHSVLCSTLALVPLSALQATSERAGGRLQRTRASPLRYEQCCTGHSRRARATTTARRPAGATQLYTACGWTSGVAAAGAPKDACAHLRLAFQHVLQREHVLALRGCGRPVAGATRRAVTQLERERPRQAVLAVAAEQRRHIAPGAQLPQHHAAERRLQRRLRLLRRVQCRLYGGSGAPLLACARLPRGAGVPRESIWGSSWPPGRKAGQWTGREVRQVHRLLHSRPTCSAPHVCMRMPAQAACMKPRRIHIPL